MKPVTISTGPNGTAERMPDHLAEDLVLTVRDIRTQERALATKRAEQDELRAKFQADIDRYLELKKVGMN